MCDPSWFTLADPTGLARWPAVPVEILFNLGALGIFLSWQRQCRLDGRHFHLYLIAYGLFRLGHEIARDTPRLFGPITGYQIASIAVMALGWIRFRMRQR